MKKPVVISALAAVLILLIAGGLLLANNSSNDTTDSPTTSDMSSMDTNDSSSSSTDSSTGESTPPVATNSVEIKDHAFAPASITVKKGTKVTWTNHDDVQHDVMSDITDVAGPSSELLSKGESYSYTFDEVGTYSYHCTPHPYMKASVTVTE